AVATGGTGGTAAGSGGRSGSATGGTAATGGAGAATGGAAGAATGGTIGAGGGAGHASGGHGGGGGALTSGAGGAGGVGGRTGTGGTGTGGASGPVRIMAIGDSVTRATCWRDFLWQQLQPSYAGKVDFVGTLQADYGCGVTGFDSDNQGYSSSLVTEVAANVTNARTCDPYCPNMSNLQTAFASAKPQVVLMHWGTNDVWNGKSSASITSAYATVIDALRTANPAVVVLLAQIIPMNVTGATCSGCSCASCSTAIPALNTAITTFAAGKTTTQSPVIVVDQYTGFDATADTRDGVHPNTQGSQKMAAKWYAALTANQLVH
ncbi:MAG: SGNH/GDSL hydrolase family protein, partial [Polyangia bacterium]